MNAVVYQCALIFFFSWIFFLFVWSSHHCNVHVSSLLLLRYFINRCFQSVFCFSIVALYVVSARLITLESSWIFCLDFCLVLRDIGYMIMIDVLIERFSIGSFWLRMNLVLFLEIAYLIWSCWHWASILIKSWCFRVFHEEVRLTSNCGYQLGYCEVI